MDAAPVVDGPNHPSRSGLAMTATYIVAPHGAQTPVAQRSQLFPNRPAFPDDLGDPFIVGSGERSR